MTTLYIDPGYTNVGWAHSNGESGYITLTGTLRDRIEQLRQFVHADRLVIEDYNASSGALSGAKTMFIIGALMGMHLHVDIVNHNTWNAEFAKRVERMFTDYTDRLQFVERFEQMPNEHERDACKIRFALGGR